MVAKATKSAFLSIGLSGVIGVVIGAAGMFFNLRQTELAEDQNYLVENQYYMELDQLRHAVILDSTRPFESRLDSIISLKDVHANGFRTVFEKNIERDIAELEDRIQIIQEAEALSAAAAAEARRQEEAKAAAAAQARKEQAVTVNPLLFDNCGRGTNVICP